jgi:hypothetical protein
MSQATHVNSTSAPVASSRRRFLTVAAAASAVGAGSLAVAAKSAPDLPTHLIGCLPPPQGDSELLQLEQTITEQRRLAQAYDPEIMRLSEIWEGELSRLEAEVNAGRETRTTRERWDAIRAMPESAEHERLVKLQQPHWEAHDAAVELMFSTPASTPQGRAAKASVILGLMAEYMMSDEEEGDYPLDLVRKLLIELGGKPGVVQVRPWEN